MKYRTILADPPWPYKTPGQIGVTLEHRPNRDKTAKSHQPVSSTDRYGAMTMEDLKALRVSEVSEDNAHLYLWTTNTFMEQAYELARSWGFDPKTIITWTKTRAKDGQPSMKMGYYFRGATEHCLFGVRGSLRLQGDAYPTALLSPRLPHSQKPDEFYAMIEQQSPGPRLEVFARPWTPMWPKRNGWHTWGNELPNDVELTRKVG